MDITPAHRTDRVRVQAYGDGGFTVSGTRHEGALILLPDRAEPWVAQSLEQAGIDTLSAVVSADPKIEILLLGTGAAHHRLPKVLAEAMRAHAIVVDAMATGAACRTFNVLVGEDRPVAAALLPVD